MVGINESLKNSAIAAIRTGAAVLVSAVITWATGHGIDVPESFEGAVNLFVFSTGVAGYNLAVNFLEKKVHPWFGVLLIVPKSPEYSSEKKEEELYGL